MRVGQKRRVAVFTVIALTGIAFQILLARNVDATTKRGADFRAFYTGARLLDTGELYSLPAMKSVARDLTSSDEYYPFVRPPWFAAVIQPVSQLPPDRALTLWRVLILAAAAGFALLGPTPMLPTFAALSWSFPLFSAVASGQDVPFLLLFLGIAILLFNRDKPFAAGLVASLCSVKIHLFLLVLLVLIHRRNWKVVFGVASGMTALGVVSMFIAGPFWCRDYLGLILSPATNPHSNTMYNLRGLVSSSPAPLPLEGLAAVCVVGAVWLISRQASMGETLCAALVGGILIGHHSYLGDLLLIVPVCVWLMLKLDNRLVGAISFVLLIPFQYILLPIEVTTCLCMCLVGSLAAGNVRKSHSLRKPT